MRLTWTRRTKWRPRLEALEGRDCPADLTVGPNLNPSGARDNQYEGAIAVDPTDPDRMFTAASSFHGGYIGAVNDMPAMGLWVSRTTTGVDGPWAGGFIARGRDDLPMAHGHPRVAYDDFGNLFLTYFTASPLHLGNTTGGNGPTTLNDTTGNWGTNEWCSHGDGWVDVTVDDVFMRRQIVSNSANQLVVDRPWDVIPPAGTPYFIHHNAGAHSVVVAMSSDGGQTFQWLANFAHSAGTSGPGPSPPDDQPLIAVGPGSGGAPGSVWVYWQNGGPGGYAATVAGAPVYGLGSVGAFGSSQSPSNAAGKKWGSIAVGPSGQLLLAYQSDLEMWSWPYHATVYTALDPDGLGPAGFNVPNNTVWTNVVHRYDIPASPDMPINAAARLAWDRSGGPHHGRVYLAYTDRPSLFTSDTNIMLRYSDNDGSSWGSAVKLNNDTGTANQFWPSLAVDQTTGHVAAVWYDTRNDPANTTVKLYGTASDNGGVSFAPNAVIATGTSRASWAEDQMRGTSTGGNGSRTLNDTTQTWATNWWGPYGAVPLTQVSIVAGTGADPNTFYEIVGNTGTQITIDRDWAVTPDATSVYQFALPYRYAFGGYTDVAFHGGTFYPVWADNSNSTLNNPDGANNPLDVYTAAVTVTPAGGGGGGMYFRQEAPAGRPGEPSKPSVDPTGLFPQPTSAAGSRWAAVETASGQTESAGSSGLAEPNPSPAPATGEVALAPALDPLVGTGPSGPDGGSPWEWN